MKFLGQQEAASFLREHSGQGETLRAWVAEVRHRKWDNLEALLVDFENVDATSPPGVVFRFDAAGLQIETFVDFRNGIVLLTGLRMTV
jgi:hypothetical protein